MSAANHRLLVVSPGFHGYHAAIGRAFVGLGHDVETFCYDAVDSPVEKVWNKARHELPAKLSGGSGHQSAETVSRRAAQRVRAARPDVVLVVRGDTLDEGFWAAAASGGRPVVVWMYDELRRTTFDAPLASRYAQIATYSALDARALIAQGIPARHVPLGYDDTPQPHRATSGSGFVTFLGAPSPARIAALNALQSSGLPIRVWGRGWSDHPIDRARTWRLRSRGLPSGRDVPGELAHAIMRNSIATLNIHGDQDGFTMRTFEAAGSGAIQLIDRADVEEFYIPGREVLVFDGQDDLVSLARRVAAEPQAYHPLREAARRRTLAEHTLTHRARSLKELWA